MSNEKRPSWLAICAGALSALIGALLFAALAGASARVGGLESGLAGLMLDSLSWAAFFVPAYFWFAAIILFIPGFRADLAFTLVGSLLPFSGLAVLASHTADPEAWFRAWPGARPLGGFGVAALSLGFALVTGAAVLVLRSRLFGRVPARDAGDAESADGMDEGYADAYEADGAPETEDLSWVRQPGLLATLSRVQDDAPAPVEADHDDNDDGMAVDAPDRDAGGLDAPGGTDDGLAADAEELDGPDDERPIPLMFGRGSGSTELAQSGMARTGAAEDPAADASFWDVAASSVAAGSVAGNDVAENDGALGAAADARPDRAPLLPSLEVFQDGEHDAALRSTGTAARPPDAAAVLPAASLVKKDRVTEAAPERPRLTPRGKPAKAYAVPTDGLLLQYPDGQYWIIDEKTRRAAEVLRETLAEFNIEAEVTGIRKGPVITMFEILPAPGVRLAKIATLSDNIALRLAASSVRIVAPIPGKHAVGIEVPNDRRSIVSFREIVESDGFNAAKMEVPVVLGKDITGEVQVAELTQTPHLLIAGATGSGKSVCVNSIILSILYKRSFNDVKLLLIDPKIVELKLYNGIPHLLTPVITEPKRAFQALQYCICEMERRYSLLDAMGVRDIRSYNRKIAEKAMATEKLPYIVVIIDEFADLMATTGKELESTLARLAAMSRAVGIHLVLATQRPSVDVITGLIKANIPSRIAFMVASKFDSRIIIDMVGAEKLLGRGDMLYSSATDAFPVRMQGAFVSDDEVERVVEWVKTLGEPDYIDDEIFIDDEDDEGGPSLFDEDEDDPLFEKALEIVLAEGKASASFLQRKLKIGYNRAARIVELMEEKGIVGKAQGSKPRDLVRNPDFGGARPPNPKARYVPDFSDDDEVAGGDEADEAEDA